MKLKITVDGKVYEVEVEVLEPEPPHPAYVPPGQARSRTARVFASSRNVPSPPDMAPKPVTSTLPPPDSALNA